MEADIVIVNHHLFFADLSIRKSDVGGFLPDYTAVIFDEAHELEEVATEYFGFHVSNFRIGELVGDAKRLSEKSETKMDDLTSVQRAADRFFGGMAMTREGRHPVQSFREFEGMDALIGALHDARHSLKKQKDFSGEWETLERRTGEIQSELEVLRNGNLENYVSWVERRGRGLFLEACPVDVSGLLREKLFERIPACVLTSATLTVAESFGYFRQRIGMEVGDELSLGRGRRRCDSARSTQPREPSFARDRCRRRGVQTAELSGHRLADRLASARISGSDCVHARHDVALEHGARDAAEVDAEVFDARAVGHRDVGRHAHEKLVQRKPFRPERDDVAQRQAGEVGDLAHVPQRRAGVLRSVQRGERQERVGNLRFDSRVPGAECGVHATLSDVVLGLRPSAGPAAPR